METRQHYHSLDTVNGERHTHETIDDLTLYMKATGEDGIKTTNCYDPKCLQQLRESTAHDVFGDSDDGAYGPLD